MTLATMIALMGAMLVLAVIPGPGVAAVIARSMALGFSHGAVTVLGIVAGDFTFIVLAILGLSSLVEILGNFFFIVKYLGAAYLIWLGISLWRSKSEAQMIDEAPEASWLGNFMAGFLVTLGNPKAILFYIGFFPAFLDLASVTTIDVVAILIITTLAIGGVMLAYAFMASRAQRVLRSAQARQRLDRVAGGVMIGTGTFLALRSQ